MKELRQTLQDALKAAGRIIRQGLSRTKDISYKGPVSLLTQIDKSAEAAILAIIRKRFPSHSILTEETANLMKPSDFTWIIDPLDGTTNYAHALPHVATSIALRYKDHTILGGVLDPFREELFFAEKGKGARLNGKPIHVSTRRYLDKSIVLSGFPYDRRKRASIYMKPWAKLTVLTQALRWEGAAALDLCWVACGRAEGFWEWHLQSWDCAAGALLVEEAGGEMSDFSGHTYDVFGPQTLATNGFIHKQMLNVFRNTRTAHR